MFLSTAVITSCAGTSREALCPSTVSLEKFTAVGTSLQVLQYFSSLWYKVLVQCAITWLHPSASAWDSKITMVFPLVSAPRVGLTYFLRYVGSSHGWPCIQCCSPTVEINLNSVSLSQIFYIGVWLLTGVLRSVISEAISIRDTNLVIP